VYKTNIKIKMIGRAVSVFGRSALRSRSSNLALREADNAAGTNMPFQTKNKTRLLFVMSAYLGLGFSIPFIAVRFQMYKKSSS